MSTDQRAYTLYELARYTGREMSWRFLSQTSSFIPQIKLFHHLISGIYKPKWSEYALSIIVKLSSPYDQTDNIEYLQDGRWRLIYSQRVGGEMKSDNRALKKCLIDNMPLGVFAQVGNTTNKKTGSTYKIMGLGLVENYDSDKGVFTIVAIDDITLEETIKVIDHEGAAEEIQIYTQVSREFQPFIKEERASYNINPVERHAAFRNVVLTMYNYSCAVCSMKLKIGDLSEVTAAHIIPKNRNGTDDPRNGIALCHNHHWAFDAGLFTISDDYTIVLSPLLQKAEITNFDLTKINGDPINLPNNDAAYPHKTALKWHRTNVWKHDEQLTY